MKLEAIAHSDPETLGGTLVFAGTRVPVQSLFDHLEAGDSIDDFLEGFPSVKREQVIAVLKEFRKELLRSSSLRNSFSTAITCSRFTLGKPSRKSSMESPASR